MSTRTCATSTSSLPAEAGWSDGATRVDDLRAGAGRPTDPRPSPTTRDRSVGSSRGSSTSASPSYEVYKRNGRVAQLEQQLAEATGRPGRVARDRRVDDLQASIYDLQLAVAELTAAVTGGVDDETGPSTSPTPG